MRNSEFGVRNEKCISFAIGEYRRFASASAQYEVEENEDDGNVVFDASNIFSKFKKN
jgi:hypothetical protein